MSVFVLYTHDVIKIIVIVVPGGGGGGGGFGGCRWWSIQ